MTAHTKLGPIFNRQRVESNFYRGLSATGVTKCPVKECEEHLDGITSCRCIKIRKGLKRSIRKGNSKNLRPKPNRILRRTKQSKNMHVFRASWSLSLPCARRDSPQLRQNTFLLEHINSSGEACGTTKLCLMALTKIWCKDELVRVYFS